MNAREQLRRAVVGAHNQIWSGRGVRHEAIDPISAPARANQFYTALENLSPKTDAQRFALNRSMQLQDEIGLTRTLLFQDSSSAISPPFLVSASVSWRARRRSRS